MTEPNQIPQGYLDLGATRGFSPVPPEEIRMFLLSKSGHGKTNFLSSIPNSIILDFERGAREVVRPQAHRIWVDSYATYLSVITLLCKEADAGKRTFQRVSFDTGDAWSDLTSRAMATERSNEKRKYDTMADFGQKGAGWAALKARLVFDLDTLYKRKYAWSVAGHVTEKDLDIGSGKDAATITVERPILSRSICGAIEAQSELTAWMLKKSGHRAPMVKKTLPGGQTIEVPGVSEQYEDYYMKIEEESIRGEGKSRLKGIAGIIQLPESGGWDAFKAHWQAAVDRINGA